MAEDFDLVIIGGGIAGINAAYRFQTEAPPGMTYTLLEGRDSIGGTWDLFRYPGIRSDSDIFTFGFAWNPWPGKGILAMGSAIKDYMIESTKKTGIDKHIQYQRKVKSANWVGEDSHWELTIQVNGDEKQLDTIRAKFIYLATGYYNYDQPRQAVIPGIDDFQGKIIHPQFWPEDYDYTQKEMVVIGSGATAITIVPSVADKVKHVTMLQRSPTYIFPLAQQSTFSSILFALAPRRLAQLINRTVWILQTLAMIYICKIAPGMARKFVRYNTEKLLPPDLPWDPHFNPRYNPWEQRLCASMDGDIFAALRSGKASIATDTIETVTKKGIRLNSGKELPADVIVTATGLDVLFAGGIQVTVDGRDVPYSQKFLWKGTMLQDVPNLFVTVGFENASWTLGCDCAAYLMTRMMWQMKEKSAKVAVPYLDGKVQMEAKPLFSLKSTYLNNVTKRMPKGGEGVWAPRSNYFTDIMLSKYGDIQTGVILK